MISVLRNQRIHRKDKRGFIKILPSTLFSGRMNLRGLLIAGSMLLMIVYLFTSGKMVPSLLTQGHMANTKAEWNETLMPGSASRHAVQSAETSLASVVAFSPKTPSQYRIEEGETLYKIAERFGLSVFELILFNHIEDPTKTRTGRILELSGSRSYRSGESSEIPFPTKLQITADKTSGIAPLEVHFALKNPPADGTYMWDLGNWIFAFGANPAYTFSHPGVYDVKLRIRAGGSMTVSNSSVTVKVLPRKNRKSFKKYLTLSHKGDMLNLPAFLPSEMEAESFSRLRVNQQPVLFDEEQNNMFVATGTGYSRITVSNGNQSHSLFAFVSPFPSVHAEERDYDWYKTQFGTGILGNCGPSTVAMVSYWATGIDTSVSTIRSEIGMPFSNGAVNFEHMIKPLRRRNIQFLARSVSSEKDITNIVDRGNVAIALIHTSQIEKTRGERTKNFVGRYYSDSVGHYVVIKGYTLDRRYFVVYDPIPSDWSSNRARYADGVSMLGRNRYYPAGQVLRALRRGQVFEIYHN
jgi:LysM repeat protein